MVKPYFEAIRIMRDADKGMEYECPVTMLFSCVCRIESPADDDDDFKNRAPKTVLYLDNGLTPWILMPYSEMQRAWVAWLDAASNIQSVFRNN